MTDLTAEEWASLAALCRAKRDEYVMIGNHSLRDFYLALMVKCDVRAAMTRDHENGVSS